MPELIHQLTHPWDSPVNGAVCGERYFTCATDNRTLVTCAACHGHPARRPRRASGGSEAALQEAMRQACGLTGWLYYHVHDSRHSPAGFPDVCAVRGDRLLFAELKQHGAEPTPQQAQWLAALRQVQGPPEVYLWTPADLAPALEVLR